MASPSSIFTWLLLLITNPPTPFLVHTKSLPQGDIDLLEFPLNLEYLEAEFFLWGALGYGLDKAAPDLVDGGPMPVGVKRAKLCPFVRDIVAQFALQEVGHIKAIKKTVKGFPRPFLDLTASNFANVIDNAIGRRLEPQFNPYENSLNFLIASYIVPYVGLTGYVGANPKLQSYAAKSLAAGLLGVESAQDAVIRTILYQRGMETVEPYNVTVAELTDKISELRNKLGGAGMKDEGIFMPPGKGAEGKIPGNVIAGNEYSIAYDRTPVEILKIVYGEGTAKTPGGFYPKGADGNIAKSLRS